jgi:hypothetical protein
VRQQHLLLLLLGCGLPLPLLLQDVPAYQL